MNRVPLFTKEARAISYVSGPLIFIQNVKGVSYGEIVQDHSSHR